MGAILAPRGPAAGTFVAEPRVRAAAPAATGPRGRGRGLPVWVADRAGRTVADMPSPFAHLLIDTLSEPPAPRHERGPRRRLFSRRPRG
jgi:hypothetical protein